MQGGEGTTTAALLSATLPIVPILVPLGLHFLLVCFVLVAFEWLSPAYWYVHLGLFLVGLWTALDKLSVIPVIAFIVVVLMSILIDIIVLGLYFDDTDQAYRNGGEARRTWQFSAAMCVINLLLKPVTIALSCIAIYARVGGANLGALFGGRRDAYSVIGGTSEAQQPQ